MVSDLLSRQAAEGYLDEYGGYDIGYLSISLSCLARLHRRRGGSDIVEAAERAIAFLEPMIRPDGTYDSGPTSRGTQFIYPFGVTYFGSDIHSRIADGLAQRRVVDPTWMDDRYTIPFTIDYLETHLHLSA